MLNNVLNLFLAFLAYWAYQFIHSSHVLLSYARASVISCLPSVMPVSQIFLVKC